MEGPRAVRKEELDSLSDLVDTVFRGSPGHTMFREYPQLFNESNLDNLLVFVDGGKVVSHYGMVQRWAALCGCTVKTACVGSVATYESHRGRGLATQLLEANIAKAAADGVDFCMISGGRGLYRQNGAVDFGYSWRVRVGAGEAAQLANRALRVRELAPGDIPACADLYARRPARFVRPADDWQWHLQSRRAMNKATRDFVALAHGTVCAYFVVAGPGDDGAGAAMEFAGSEQAVAGALAPLLETSKLTAVALPLQEHDALLRQMLETAACRPEPPQGSCTLMLLNFPQLMQRLRPWFAMRVGMDKARAMAFRQPEEQVYVFACEGAEMNLEGRAAAADFVFRPGNEPARPRPWDAVFPVPGLWYGLNYA